MLPLTEVLAWRHKADQRSGASDDDNNLRLRVILNLRLTSSPPFRPRRPAQRGWLQWSAKAAPV